MNEPVLQSSLPTEVFDHLADGVLLVSGGRVTSASGRAAEMLGLPVGRIVGTEVCELLPSAVSPALERLEEGASSVTLRGLAWDRPGPLRRVTFCATPGPQGGETVLQIRDDSDPSGQAAADGFRRRLSWLGSLAAGIAHEIRNPLGGIRGAAQLLRRGPEDDELDELTTLIIHESDRIDAMVEQLMGLTRPQCLERVHVDLNRLVHDEVALLEAQFGPREVSWELDLDPSLPPVEGDRLRLREAVGNILRNAREAATRSIRVRTRIEAGGRLTEGGFDRGRCLQLEVTDDGPGIPEDEVASIFAPFSTSKPEGTGLGLFVTRQVIDAHGARISLDPRPGQGACFSLLLSERLAPAPETDPTLADVYPAAREAENRYPTAARALETHR